MNRNLVASAVSALAALVVLLLPGAAGAAPTQITNCANDSDLRTAVADGGDYVFQCPPGAHSLGLSAPLAVTSSVSLDATGQDLKLVNTSGPTGHIFEVGGGTLTLVNLKFFSLKIASSAAPGTAGTNGTDGAKGADVPCEAGQTPGTGGNGTPPLNNATGGSDGSDLLGGAIFMGPGTTVNLYGGKFSGSLSGGYGGYGGAGGKGGSGGRGGSPTGGTDCNVDIHGGKGGEATDGADGGDGGTGGDAKGAAVYVSPTATLNVKGTLFDSLTVQGGSGGNGGNGGEGGWAGQGGIGCGWIVCQPYFLWYGPHGDYSGTGGDAGKGGASGTARGGAIYSEGTVNLTDAKFSNVTATSKSSGDGGQGGAGGNGHGNGEPPVGNGGNGGNGGPVGSSLGGAVFSSGTLNVYSAEFDHPIAGLGTAYGGNNGGTGGEGGMAPYSQNGTIGKPEAVGGHGGNGAAGGDAAGGSIFGAIDYRGCVNFTAGEANGGAGGTAGRGGQSAGAAGIPGVAGSVGIAGLSGMVDPVGFAPYPCPAGPPAEAPPGSAVCKDGVDNDNDKLIDGADPGCQLSGPPGPSPPGTPDKDAPRASLFGREGQKLGKDVAVGVSCISESCVATAGGDVSVAARPKAAKLTRLGPVTKSIPKGGKATLRLKLSKKLAASIRKALRAHRKVIVNVRVVVADAAGNKRALTRKIRLKL